MRAIHFIFIGFLALIFLIINYDVSSRDDVMKQAGLKINSDDPRDIQKEETYYFSTNQHPEQTEQFVTNFKQEAVEIGKVQSDPVKTQLRLKKLTEKMTQHEVRAMYEIISDDTNDADQRALALELLTIKNDTASLTALQNFVANNKNINGQEWDRKKELETVLRAQAVEGIANYQNKDIALSTLSFLQHKVDQKFLSDRISRASNNLFNGGPKLEQQDDDALKKLIE